MKKVLLFLLLIACAAFSQDYMRNNGTYFRHSTGRTPRYFAQSETVWVNRSYPLWVRYTATIDTALSTAWLRICPNGDTTKYVEVRGSTGGGESYATPGSELVRFYLVKGDSTNRPFRMWGN